MLLSAVVALSDEWSDIDNNKDVLAEVFFCCSTFIITVG